MVSTLHNSSPRSTPSPEEVAWTPVLTDDDTTMVVVETPVLASSAVRSDQVWFDDGNTVILCESTLFRVFRGIISAHSSVFRDLFSIPQPAESADMYDGCPVVPLYDNATDLTYFLKALHDSTFLNEQNSYTRTVAFLRLGTKYGVAHLRRYALEELEKEYPNTLENYDALADSPNGLSWGKGTAPCNSFEILNLARGLDLPYLLPVAFYAAASKSLPHILQGRDSPGGGHFEIVNEHDKLLCVAGREKLSKSRLRLFNFLTKTTIEGCVTPDKCLSERHKWLVKQLMSEKRLLSFRCNRSSHSLKKAFCTVCVEKYVASFETTRQKIWEELPSYFELPDWEQLLKHKKKDMLMHMDKPLT